MKRISIALAISPLLAVAKDEYKSAEFILSGSTEEGEFWQLFIDCSVDESGNEIVSGALEVDGILLKGENAGQRIEATIEPLVYYGDSVISNENIVGWYFESWPRACAHLPN